MRLLTHLIMALTFTAACSQHGGAKPDDAAVVTPDGGIPDASCFTTAAADCANPSVSAEQCNIEIINACTTAQKIYNTSKPPLLNPDGTLPPLPD